MLRFLLPVLLVFPVCSVCAQDRQRGRGTPEQFVEFILRAQDSNNDGSISSDEANDRLKTAFSRIDTDGDGSLSRAELMAMARRLRNMRPENRDGGRRQPGGQGSTDDVQMTENIAYHSEHDRQKLDLFLPKKPADSPRPAIVFIHGGGWRGGDKGGGMWRSLPMEYAVRGYVCVSVNYRLTGDGVDIFGCIDDCRCAVRWLRAHAEEYNVDPNRIGAYGNSAGAHLVSLLGVTEPKKDELAQDAPFREHSSRFQAVCCSAPPTNFNQWGEDTQPRFAHLFKEDDKSGRETASPVTFADADAPPFLIIHGTADRTVPVQQGDDLAEKLKAAGADVTYIRVDGAGHGVFGQHSAKTKPAMEKFFARVLKQE